MNQARRDNITLVESRLLNARSALETHRNEAQQQLNALQRQSEAGRIAGFAERLQETLAEVIRVANWIDNQEEELENLTRSNPIWGAGDLSGECNECH